MYVELHKSIKEGTIHFGTLEQWRCMDINTVCLQWVGFNCSMLSGQLGTLTHMHRPKTIELQRKECIRINDVTKSFILLMYVTHIAFLEIGK